MIYIFGIWLLVYELSCLEFIILAVVLVVVLKASLFFGRASHVQLQNENKKLSFSKNVNKQLLFFFKCKQATVIFKKCKQKAVIFQKCKQTTVIFQKCKQTTTLFFYFFFDGQQISF